MMYEAIWIGHVQAWGGTDPEVDWEIVDEAEGTKRYVIRWVE